MYISNHLNTTVKQARLTISDMDNGDESDDEIEVTAKEVFDKLVEVSLKCYLLLKVAFCIYFQVTLE